MLKPIYFIFSFILSFCNLTDTSDEEISEYCIYNLDETQKCQPNPDFSYSTDPKVLKSYPEIEVPVVFWGVNKDDGTSEDALTKKKIRASIRLLNKAFKEMKICFVLREYKTIDATEIYWTEYNAFNRFIRVNQYVEAEALNIYVPFRFTNFRNNLRGGKWSWNQLSVNSLNTNTGILPHEVGHIFGLAHMHSGFKSKNCERVTRDANDPDYNANCSGDQVTDTNAMPNLYTQFHLINEDCEYIGDLENCKGEKYKLTEADIRNFMGYTKHVCRSQFTIGQGIRAREYIDKFSKKNKYKFLKMP